jgi:hypothetical protein
MNKKITKAFLSGLLFSQAIISCTTAPTYNSPKGAPDSGYGINSPKGAPVSFKEELTHKDLFKTYNRPEKDKSFSLKSEKNYNQTAAGKASSVGLSKANQHASIDKPLPASLTIGATASQYSGYYSLWGSCTEGGGLVHLNITEVTGGYGYTDVACVGGKWIFNEAYLGVVSTWTATQGSQSVTYTLDGTNLYSDASAMPDCQQPYTWVHEMTNAFGTLECHAVAYCSNGNPYVYADWIADDCQI